MDLVKEGSLPTANFSFDRAHEGTDVESDSGSKEEA